MRRLRDTGFFDATLPSPNGVDSAPCSDRLRFRNQYVVSSDDNGLTMGGCGYGFGAAGRSNSGSVVAGLDKHSWKDADWLQQASVTNWLEEPIGVFFFFQAEDGIRDSSVTGVQTCALPI